MNINVHNAHDVHVANICSVINTGFNVQMIVNIALGDFPTGSCQKKSRLQMHDLKPDFQGRLKSHSSNCAHKVTRGYPLTLTRERKKAQDLVQEKIHICRVS